MIDPALEAELSSKSIAELETDVIMVVWHYFKEKLYGQPKHVIRRLDQMSCILTRMRKECEQGALPPGDMEEKRTAHAARELGWLLIWRANLIGQGRGNTLILDSQTKKPSRYKDQPVTILDWVRQFLDPNAHPIREELLKQSDLAHILQWKVDLLSAFQEARKLFNAYKLRKSDRDSARTHDRKRLGTQEARRLITETMRVVWRCRTRPLPTDIENEAHQALACVLDKSQSPLEAAIPLVQRLARDKLVTTIAADTVRQAAEYKRNKPPMSNGLSVKIGEKIIRSSDGVSGAIAKAQMAHLRWRNSQPGSHRKKRSAKTPV
ncbi:MAG TPA: hypothetical protein PKE31_13605 [Pseudomonadota bacterium]|mgnify:CR=1 FL=1|nr:hypothetical protein [Pseudomonadota bacterium]